MVLTKVGLAIVVQQVLVQPAVSFGFRFWLVEVVESNASLL